MIASVPYGCAVIPWPSVHRRATAVADPDAALLERGRAGDEAALEALVSRHEGEIYRVCRRLLPDREDALDATQETFLRAFRALRDFRGEAAFRTWIFGIALNACRSRVASAEARPRRHRVALVSADPDGGAAVELPLPDPSPGPEERAYGGELRQALASALARLSPEHRAILVLREIEELEYDDLAGVLGLTPGTVKSRLARARAALRQALAGVWP
jgi:RNA polymerase sigma-70 factor (ECF subfamily)